MLFWLPPLLVLALAMFLVVLVHDFDYLPFEGVTLKEIVVHSSHSGQLLTGDLHLLVYVVQVNGGVPGGVRGEDVQDKGGGVGLAGLVIHWGISELIGMTLLLVTVGDTEGADGVSGGIHG